MAGLLAFRLQRLPDLKNRAVAKVRLQWLLRPGLQLRVQLPFFTGFPFNSAELPETIIKSGAKLITKIMKANFRFKISA